MLKTGCDQVVLNDERVSSVASELRVFDATTAGVWSHFCLFPSLIRSVSWLKLDTVDVGAPQPIELIASQC